MTPCQWVRRKWRQFLARTRLSLRAVFEESAGMGDYDYHDLPDDENGKPWFFGEMRCKRCGKTFRV